MDYEIALFYRCKKKLLKYFFIGFRKVKKLQSLPKYKKFRHYKGYRKGFKYPVKLRSKKIRKSIGYKVHKSSLKIAPKKFYNRNVIPKKGISTKKFYNRNIITKNRISTKNRIFTKNYTRFLWLNIKKWLFISKTIFNFDRKYEITTLYNFFCNYGSNQSFFTVIKKRSKRFFKIEKIPGIADLFLINNRIQKMKHSYLKINKKKLFQKTPLSYIRKLRIKLKALKKKELDHFLYNIKSSFYIKVLLLASNWKENLRYKFNMIKKKKRPSNLTKKRKQGFLLFPWKHKKHYIRKHFRKHKRQLFYKKVLPAYKRNDPKMNVKKAPYLRKARNLYF